jgi:hypothetical protein
MGNGSAKAGSRQERDEPHRLVYDVKRILHNVPVTVAPFIVVVPPDWNGEPLRVSCKVHADGQPDPAEMHADLVAGSHHRAWSVDRQALQAIDHRRQPTEAPCLPASIIRPILRYPRA